MRFNSKAISSLIATVLMILITIAAVGIIVQAVMPMIKGNIEATSQCDNAKIEVNTEMGFTCYDPSVNIVSISVSRGPENVAIDGIQIKLVDSSGQSQIAEVRQGGNYTFIDSTQMPEMNSEKSFNINASVLNLTNIERVSVIPIIKIGKTSKVCGSSGVVELPRCSSAATFQQTVPPQNPGPTFNWSGLITYWKADGIMNHNFESGSTFNWTIVHTLGTAFVINGDNAGGNGEGSYSVGSFNGADYYQGYMYSANVTVPANARTLRFRGSGFAEQSMGHCNNVYQDAHMGWDDGCNGSIDLKFNWSSSYGIDVWYDVTLDVSNFSGRAGCFRGIDADSGGCSWVGWDNLRFFDASGNDLSVADSTTNGNSLAFSSATISDGKIGQAYYLDGSNDYLQSTRTSSQMGLTGNPSFSISLWFKQSGTWSGTWAGLVGWGSPDSFGSMVHIGMPSSTAVYFTNPSRDFTINSSIQPNVWYHVVAIYNSSNNQATAYFNGVYAGAYNNFGPFNLPNSPIRIGYNNAGTSPWTKYFPGSIDEVSIWNRMLSASEVAQLYNSGAGLTYP